MIKYLLTALLCILAHILTSQQRLGINTASPSRILELSGSADQFLRIHSSSVGGNAGIEFMRGKNNVAGRDWRMVNDGGALRFSTSVDDFATTYELMRISSLDNMGIGTNIPATRLHVDGNSNLIFGDPGLLRIGPLSNDNLAFDKSHIRAFHNNGPSPLYLQPTGGHTRFGINGGNTYMAMGGGRVGVGTFTLDAALNIDDPGFQLFLRNASDGSANDWYIGASNSSWVAGDNQLLFSPTSSSSDAVLRLMNVTENNGTVAPVMIYQNYNHTLLLDGNEIDTRGTPLYINHNTESNTLINPTGGRVGVGTNNPQAMLHVFNSDLGANLMTLQLDNVRWHINPYTGGTQNLAFVWHNNGIAFAQIHGQTGQWMAASDRRLKENLLSVGSVLEDVKQLKTYSYTFKDDVVEKTYLGIMAQEAETLFPEMVEKSDGQYGVAYAQLAVIGVRAFQEQQEIIDTLKEKLALLKKLRKEGKTIPEEITKE